MLSDYIDRYNKFQNDNTLVYNNHITFLLLDRKYYLIYNEKSSINANDLPICFMCNGIFKMNNDIHYYIVFDEINKKIILEKLKDYSVTIIDESFNIVEFNDRNKRNLINNYLKTMMQQKNVSFMSNMGNMGNMGINHQYTMMGNYTQKFLKNKNPDPVTNFKIDEIYGFLKDTKLKIDKVKMTSNKNSGVSIDEFENDNDNKEITISELEGDNACVIKYYSNGVSQSEHIIKKNFKKTVSDMILEDYDIIALV
jgi:hypothetical protein